MYAVYRTFVCVFGRPSVMRQRAVWQVCPLPDLYVRQTTQRHVTENCYRSYTLQRHMYIQSGPKVSIQELYTVYLLLAHLVFNLTSI
jgi:hypothetical protein